MLTWFQRSPRSSIPTTPVLKRKKGWSSSMKLSKQKTGRRLTLEAGAAVLVALGLDILGEPPASWHPVAWYGKCIQRLEQAAPHDHFAQLLYGGVMLLLTAPTAILPAAMAHQLAKRVRAEALQRGCTAGGFIGYVLVE